MLDTGIQKEKMFNNVPFSEKDKNLAKCNKMFPADLGTFTEKLLNRKFHFLSSDI